jgi:hypothetical protein
LWRPLAKSSKTQQKRVEKDNAACFVNRIPDKITHFIKKNLRFWLKNRQGPKNT